MFKVTYICIFLFIYSFCLGKTSELDEYNLEIKKYISPDYSGSFDQEKKHKKHKKSEDIWEEIEDYFQEKEHQYREYKKDLEGNLSRSLNSRIVPDYFDKNLEVIVKLDENLDKIKLKYRYTPDFIKESYVDLGLDEKEFKLSYVYKKPIDGLGGYFFDSVGYIFDNSVRNILEISKMKVK